MARNDALGTIIGLGIVGFGGYFLYQKFKAPTAAGTPAMGTAGNRLAQALQNIAKQLQGGGSKSSGGGGAPSASGSGGAARVSPASASDVGASLGNFVTLDPSVSGGFNSPEVTQGIIQQAINAEPTPQPDFSQVGGGSTLPDLFPGGFSGAEAPTLSPDTPPQLDTGSLDFGGDFSPGDFIG